MMEKFSFHILISFIILTSCYSTNDRALIHETDDEAPLIGFWEKREGYHSTHNGVTSVGYVDYFFIFDRYKAFAFSPSSPKRQKDGVFRVTDTGVLVLIYEKNDLLKEYLFRVDVDTLEIIPIETGKKDILVGVYKRNRKQANQYPWLN